MFANSLLFFVSPLLLVVYWPYSDMKSLFFAIIKLHRLDKHLTIHDLLHLNCLNTFIDYLVVDFIDNFNCSNMPVCTRSWVIRKHVCLHNSTQLSLYLFLYLSAFMLFCWGLFIHVSKSIYFICKYLSKFIIFIDNIQTRIFELNDCEIPCYKPISFGVANILYWYSLKGSSEWYSVIFEILKLKV